MRYSCYLLLRLKCAKSGSRVKMFVTEKQKFEKRAASEQAAGQSRTKSPLTSWNVRDKQREGLLVLQCRMEEDEEDFGASRCQQLRPSHGQAPGPQ